MARQKTDRPTAICSNPDCTSEVQPRRPSKSGDHWCSRTECQAAKQRQLRAKNRRDRAAQGPMEDEKVSLVRAALHLPRRKCPDCDLEDAVSGFIHRSAPGSSTPCFGTGGGGMAAGPAWIDLIHPERVSA